MRNKIFLAFLLCVMSVSCACGEERIFVKYPTLGECTADSVRIRNSPNTSAKIIGKLNEYEQITVLRRVKAKSGIWYEVDNPAGIEEAYVFGKYIAPAYRQEFQRSPAAKLLTDIRLTYGETTEKMRALSERSPQITRRNDDGIHFLLADWGDYRALYYEGDEEIPGRLKSLEVKSGNKPFGNLHIGDSTNKLRRELGNPENESQTLWEYNFYLYGYSYGTVEELVDMCIFKFTIDDGKISRMYYYSHEDGEDGETEW